MKIIIAGSRGFEDYGMMVQKLDHLFKNNRPTEIVSGRARGADKLGERYAQDHGIPVKYFPADWDKYGKSAGFRRNEEMARYADAVVIFWDGKSAGTKHMIDLATKCQLKGRVIKY